jgi:hypothetical protein
MTRLPCTFGRFRPSIVSIPFSTRSRVFLTYRSTLLLLDSRYPLLAILSSPVILITAKIPWLCHTC